MSPDEALPKLKAMLGDATSPMETWPVFKAFTRLPVQCADDGVLFQCGVYDFTGQELFCFDFVRQFSIETDGEYDHMEQLHCEFTCEPHSGLRSLQATVWAYDFTTLGDYFRHVEQLQEFREGLQGTGWKTDVYQEVV
jgi:hypothetical protein